MNNAENIEKAQSILEAHGVKVLTEIGISLANTVKDMKDNLGYFKPGSAERQEQWQNLAATVDMLQACQKVLGHGAVMTKAK